MIRLAVRMLLAAWMYFVSAAALGDTVVKVVVEGDQIALPKRVGGRECTVSATAARPGDKIALYADHARVRRDRNDLTIILRTDNRKLFLVYHQPKLFSELGWPVNYKQYFSSESVRSYDDLMRFTVLTQTDPVELTVQGLPAIDQSFTVSNGLRQQYRVRVVLAESRLDTSGMLLQLQKLLNILKHGGFGWAEVLPLTKGMPMVWEEAERQPETEFIYRERVERVEELEVGADTYNVPAGYRKVEFQGLCAPLR